jgi:hypothetical protein
MMLEITQIKGEQALLHQRLDSSIQAMTSHLQALQGDMRGVQEKLDQVAHHQSDFRDHSSGLERLGRSLEKLVSDNERRWEAHERDNATTAKTVNTHATGIRVSWVAACVLAAVLTWLGNSQLARVRERMDDHLSAGNETKRAIEARFQRIEADQRETREDMKVLKTP